MNEARRLVLDGVLAARRVLATVSLVALAAGACLGAGCAAEETAEVGESEADFSGGPPATAVPRWNTFTANLVASAGIPAAPQAHALTVSQIAVHDAINSISKKYRSYAFSGPSPSNASVPAAVAAASRDTLVALVPQAAAAIDAEYNAALASIPNSSSKTAGITAGQQAAAAILAERTGDDFNALIFAPYTPGAPAPGVYQPTPPLNFVILAGLSSLPTFALESAAQFRSDSPLTINSNSYKNDYNEVKSIGSAVSITRTQAQTDTALFWYDVAVKEWNVVAQKGLRDVNANEWRAARTLAVLNIALMDSTIASFDTKYLFNFWRPITAIRAGDTDGNSSTVGDPNWNSFCVTPPFPEYNSTHAVTGAAASSVLALEVGDFHNFSFPSPTGATRTFNRFSDAAYEEGISRIYCGIHFRDAMYEGFEQGTDVAFYVNANVLRKL